MHGDLFPVWLDGPRSRSPIPAMLRRHGGVARAHGRPPMTSVSSEAGDIFVETLDLEDAGAFLAQWRDLATRALEPNAFMEPAFALAAAQHLGQNPCFVMIWQGRPELPHQLLLGVFAMQRPSRLRPRAAARLWTHNQSALATPMLDRDRAAAALAAFFAHWRRAEPRQAAILFPLLMLEGPLAGLLRQRGRVRVLDEHRRGVLQPGDDPQGFLTRALTARRMRKLQRARDRLEEEGGLSFRIATDPDAVRAATERFLMLEAQGWKGRRGTALLNTVQLASFARTLTRGLAGVGKCRIYSLERAGTPLAMMIVLTSGDRAFAWKMAYDEAFAAASPGVQVTLDITRALMTDPAVAMTDSCAGADHPMIDRMWPDRAAVGDLLVATGVGTAAAFVRAGSREALRRALRRRLKEAVLWLRRHAGKP